MHILLASLLKHISYKSAAGATLAVGLLNLVWYSPLLFGEVWLANPLAAKTLQLPALTLLASIGGTYINALVIAGFASFCGLHGWREGLILSIWLGAGLVALSLLNEYMFMNISAQAATIEIIHSFLKVTIMCLFATMWYRRPSRE